MAKHNWDLFAASAAVQLVLPFARTSRYSQVFQCCAVAAADAFPENTINTLKHLPPDASAGHCAMTPAAVLGQSGNVRSSERRACAQEHRLTHTC